MERKVINPWTWQDPFGFVQANELKDVGRLLVCSGQTSIDENGRAVHEGDIRAQINLSIDNLETVLAEAGMKLSDVVRLNWYTTDMEAFRGASDTLRGRLESSGCRATTTLLGVTRLAFPELMVEFEATAAV